MRAKWIMIGIFAPELVVSTAFAQYLTARWLKQEIQKDVKYRNENVRQLPCDGWDLYDSSHFPKTRHF